VQKAQLTRERSDSALVDAQRQRAGYNEILPEVALKEGARRGLERAGRGLEEGLSVGVVRPHRSAVFSEGCPRAARGPHE